MTPTLKEYNKQLAEREASAKEPEGKPGSYLKKFYSWQDSQRKQSEAEDHSIPEEKQSDGVLAAAAKGTLAAGIRSFPKFAGSAIEYVGSKLDSLSSTGDQGFDTLAEWGGNARKFWEEQAQKFAPSEAIQGSIWDNPELLAKGEWWAYNVPSTFVSMLPSVVPAGAAYRVLRSAGALRKAAQLGAAVVGGGFGGAQEGASTYEELLDKGATREEAALGAELMTFASAGLNAISMDGALSRMGGKGVAKHAMNFIMSGGTEGLTEWMEAPAEEIIKMGLGFSTPKEFFQRLKDEVNVIPPSFLMGGGSALAFDGSTRSSDEILDELLAKKQDADLAEVERLASAWEEAQAREAAQAKGAGTGDDTAAPGQEAGPVEPTPAPPGQVAPEQEELPVDDAFAEEFMEEQERRSARGSEQQEFSDILDAFTVASNYNDDMTIEGFISELDEEAAEYYLNQQDCPAEIALLLREHIDGMATAANTSDEMLEQLNPAERDELTFDSFAEGLERTPEQESEIKRKFEERAADFKDSSQRKLDELQDEYSADGSAIIQGEQPEQEASALEPLNAPVREDWSTLTDKNGNMLDGSDKKDGATNGNSDQSAQDERFFHVEIPSTSFEPTHIDIRSGRKMEIKPVTDQQFLDLGWNYTVKDGSGKVRPIREIGPHIVPVGSKQAKPKAKPAGQVRPLVPRPSKRQNDPNMLGRMPGQQQNQIGEDDSVINKARNKGDIEDGIRGVDQAGVRGGTVPYDGISGKAATPDIGVQPGGTGKAKPVTLIPGQDKGNGSNDGALDESSKSDVTTEAPSIDDRTEQINSRLEEINESASGIHSSVIVSLYQQIGGIVADVRLQDAEDVGRLYHQVAKGELSAKEYSAYLKDLVASNKAKEIYVTPTEATKPDLPSVETVTESSETPATPAKPTNQESWSVDELQQNVKAPKENLDPKPQNVTDAFLVLNGVSARQDHEADRVKLEFDGKPSAAVRKDLKSEGWHWSPRNKAWQRKNTNMAVQSAKRILNKHYSAKTEERPAAINKDPWQMTLADYKNAILSGSLDFVMLGKDKRNVSEVVSSYNNVKKNSPDDTYAIELETKRLDGIVSERHNAEVTSAYASGKPVPSEVLAEYPELAKRASTKADEQRADRADSTKGVTTEEPAEDASTKEPWQMTKDEYQYNKNLPKYNAIMTAIKEGKDIILSLNRRAIRFTKTDELRLTKQGNLQIQSGWDWLNTTNDQVDELAAQAGIKPIPFGERVYHHSIVEDAYKAGKTIPAEVLAEYPELTKAEEPDEEIDDGPEYTDEEREAIIKRSRSLKPMSSLKFTTANKFWSGNVTHPDSPFITDGRVMIDTRYALKKMLKRLRKWTTEKGRYGSGNPIAIDQAQKVWDTSTGNLAEGKAVTLMGWADTPETDFEKMAYFDAVSRYVYCNALTLKLIQSSVAFNKIILAKTAGYKPGDVLVFMQDSIVVAAARPLNHSDSADSTIDLDVARKALGLTAPTQEQVEAVEKDSDEKVDPRVGASWMGFDGSDIKKRRIVSRGMLNGREVYLLTYHEDDNRGGDYVNVDKIDQEIELDAQKIKDVEARIERARLQEELDAAERLVYEDVDGFTEGMAPMKKGAVLKALNKMYRDSQNPSEEIARKDIIRRYVNNGAVVEGEGDERSLVNKDGFSISNKDITKTGLDYAEHLIEKRSLAETSKSRTPEIDIKIIEIEKVIHDLKMNLAGNERIAATTKDSGRKKYSLLRIKEIKEELEESNSTLRDLLQEQTQALMDEDYGEETDPADAINEDELSELLDKYYEELIEQPEKKKATKPKAANPNAPIKTGKPKVDAPKRNKAEVSASIKGNIKKAFDEAKSGLADIFGTDGNLGLLPPHLDQEKYDRASVHFRATWEAIKAAGQGLSEWVKLILDPFKGNPELVRGLKPYVLYFAREVNENARQETADTSDSTRSTSNPPLVDGSTGTPDGVSTGPDKTPIEDGTKGDIEQRPEHSPDDQTIDGTKTQDGTRPGVGSGARDEHSASGGNGPATGERTPAGEDAGGSTELGGQLGDEGLGTSDGTLNADNHVILADHDIAPKGKITRIRGNVRAIKLLKKLEKSKRNPTKKEAEILAQYVGWGALAQEAFLPEAVRYTRFFDKENFERTVTNREDTRQAKKILQWFKEVGKPLHPALGGVMTEEEWDAANFSILNAHYTERGVIKKMWDMVDHLGFKGGTVLEPSAGTGHFFGLMPEGMARKSELHGIELDSITGRILKKLYPDANVQVRGFEESRNINDNTVDLVISNFPFGKIPISGEKSNKYYDGWSIHNYFFGRSIDKVKPGGLVVAITSHFTLDALGNAEQRQQLGEKASLVGAIRLPNTAFSANAGTDVTTDILIFRKNDGGISTDLNNAFSRAVELETATGDKVSVNEYFRANPDMVLGEHSAKGSMHGGEDEYTLAPSKTESLEDGLTRAISLLPESIAGVGSIGNNEATSFEESTEKEGRLLSENGKTFKIVNGMKVPHRWDVGSKETRRPATKKQAKQLDQAMAKYAELRESLWIMIEAHRDDSTPGAVIEKTRKAVDRLYDAFVSKHGNLNVKANRDAFIDDVDYPLVGALETIITTSVITKYKSGEKKGQEYIKDVETYKKADALLKRTIFPGEEPAKADNKADAISMSQFYKGRLDLPYIAKLLSLPEESIQEELRDAGDAFLDPATGVLMAKNSYLSGDVRVKLIEAEAAVKKDKSYEANVAALKEIIPETIPIELISSTLGATWLPPSVVSQFATSVLGGDVKVTYVEFSGEGRWIVTPNDRAKGSAQNSQVWAASSKKGHNILHDCLNLKHSTIWDKEQYFEDGQTKTRRVVNKEETRAARDKQKQLRKAFTEWMRETPAVATELESIYNEKFNAIINKTYSVPKIDFYPGASKTISLYDHQKLAVQRGLENSVLLDYGVGSGKTYIFITLAMEMRRLKTARKPMIVVHNSTITQYQQSFHQLYPTARVLIPNTKEREGWNMQRLMGQVATGDYDAVVVPQSWLNRMENDPIREAAYIREELAQMEELIRISKEEDGGNSITAKQLVAKKKKKEKKMQKLLARGKKSKGLTFDDLGVDALLIDEAHAYKRTEFYTQMTNVRGIDTDSSGRSASLMLKKNLVQENNGGKNVVLATGTPISNTMAELWSFMRYVRPDLLKKYNIESFDGFASMFAEIKLETEETAAGTFKDIERFSTFVNGPELLAMWREATDTVLSEDLGLKLPRLKGDGYEQVAVERTRGVGKIIKSIRSAYEAWEALSGKEKKEQSAVPLMLYLEARKVAIDPRMVDPNAKEEKGCKLHRVADDTYASYKASNSFKGTQMLFCDLRKGAGEKGHEFDAYAEMKRLLVARGIPANEIVYASDFNTDVQKKRFIDGLRSGAIRVAIGHTEKMGVGVDAPQKMVALRHIDVLTRPMDFEQRNGRIVRQGNENDEVSVVVYGVKNTLDSSQFGRLVRKMKFINQIKRGETTGRTFDDPFSEDQGFAESMQAELSPVGEHIVALKNMQRELRDLQSLHSSDAKSRSEARRQIGQIDYADSLHTRVQKQFESELKELKAIFPSGKITDMKILGKEYNYKDGRKALLKLVEADNAKLDKAFDKEKFTWVKWDENDGLNQEKYTRKTTIKINGIEVLVATRLKARFTPGTGRYEVQKAEDAKREFGAAIVSMEGFDCCRSYYSDIPLERILGGVRESYNNALHGDNTVDGMIRSINGFVKRAESNITRVVAGAAQQQTDRADLEKSLTTKFEHGARIDELKTDIAAKEKELTILSKQMRDDELAEDAAAALAEDAKTVTETNGPMMSTKSKPTGKGSTVEAVQRNIKTIKKQYGVPVEVVQSISDLPAHLQGFLKSAKGKIVRGLYDPSTGTVYLVADGISNRREAVSVVLHEIVGHRGLRAVVGKEYDSYMERLAGGKHAAEIAALQKSLGLTDKRLAAEEWFARQVESGNLNQSLWSRFKSMVTRALRSLGFDIKFNDADLRALVQRSHEAALSGGKAAKVSGALASQQEPKAEWYSQMEMVLDKKLPGRGTKDSYRNMIRSWVKKGEIKPEEVEWSGILETQGSPLFGNGSDKVSKADVLEWFAGERVELEEINKVGAAFEINPSEYDTPVDIGEPTQEMYDGIKEQHGDAPETMNIEKYGHESLGGDNIYLLIEAEYPNGVKKYYAVYPGDSGYYLLASNEENPTKNPEDFDSARKIARLEITDGIRRDIEEEMDKSITAKHEEYQEPGGRNYQELLLALPDKKTIINEEARKEAYRKFDAGGITIEERNRLINKTLVKEGEEGYQSSHWDEENVLAHVRTNDRIAPDGKKVLFIEEIQSDWHQDGREQGYGITEPSKRAFWVRHKDNNKVQMQDTISVLDKISKYKEDVDDGLAHYEDNEGKTIDEKTAAEIAKEWEKYWKQSENLIPNAPFKKSWPLLTLKKVIRMAAEGGYDRIAWTTGKQQVDRYEESLRQNVDAIEYAPEILYGKDGEELSETLYEISAIKDGKETLSRKGLTVEKLQELLGKDIASKIEKNEGVSLAKERPLRPEWKRLEGKDLSIGGQGMKGFYDDMLPSIAKKYIKKWGAVPRMEKVDKHTGVVHAFDVTPKMEQAALMGQPLFSVKDAEENPDNLILGEEKWHKRLQRNIQDQFNRIQAMQDTVGKKIKERLDVYMDARLMTGKGGARIDKFNDNLIGHSDSLLNRMVKDGIAIHDMDYYLIAKDRDGYIDRVQANNPDYEPDMFPISEEEAEAIVETYEQSGNPYQKYAKEIYAIARENLKNRLEAGLIDEASYESLIASDQFYVPFKGTSNSTQNGNNYGSVGKGISVTRKEFYRPKGRASIPDSPIAQLAIDYIDGVVRSEKNTVANTFLDFINEVGEDMVDKSGKKVFEVEKQQYLPVYDRDGEIIYMNPLITSAEREGIVVIVKRNEEIIDDNGDVTGEKNNTYLITIKDAALAESMKQLGASKAIPILSSVNQYLRTINTVINPEFLLTNFERDIQAALVHVSGEHSVKMAAQVAKDIPAAMKGIWRNLRRKAPTEYSEWHQRFLDNGGKVGFFDMQTNEEKLKGIERQIRRFNGNGRNIGAVLGAVGEYVGNANEVVESAVRVATFRKLVESGLSEKKAALYAKGMTVDFNLKGNWGTVINSMYLFANAGIQGSFRIFTAMKSPTVRKIVGGVVAFSFMLALFNQWADEDEWEKVSDYNRDNYWMFMTPWGKAITIKLPYGYNIPVVMGNVAAEAASGRLTPVEAITRVLDAVNNAFNPFGGGTFAQTLTPTILDPIVQLTENQNFFGGPIYKEQPAYGAKKPASQMHFSGVSVASKAVTDFIHNITGGTDRVQGEILGIPTEINPEIIDHITSNLTGGVGRFAANIFNAGYTLAEGEIPELNKIPFARHAVKGGSEWTTLSRLRKVLDDSGRRVYATEQHEKFYQSLMTLLYDKAIEPDYAKRLWSQYRNNQLKARYSVLQ